MAAAQRRNDTRIILVGKTGSGKSSLGNTILGKSAFPVSHAFQSPRHYATEKVWHYGGELEVVDTPGLFHLDATSDEIAADISRAVQSLQPESDAILFVTKLGRFTEEETQAYNCLKAIFDNNVSNFIIVFTGGDFLDQSETNMEEILNTAPSELKEILNECENRYVVFDNVTTDKEKRKKQEKMLLQKISLLTQQQQRSKPFPKKTGCEKKNTSPRTMAKKLIDFELSELKREETKQQDQRKITILQERQRETSIQAFLPRKLIPGPLGGDLREILTDCVFLFAVVVYNIAVGTIANTWVEK